MKKPSEFGNPLPDPVAMRAGFAGQAAGEEEGLPGERRA
jgi:hypothetical protein